MKWVFNPPIGTYIAIAAFFAIVVTIWPPRRKSTKILWICVFLGLTGFEINTLYKTRDSQNQEFKELIGQLTGGDSFCYFTVAPNEGFGTPITYPLSVWVKGKYPMRNVVAEIQLVYTGQDAQSLERQRRSMHTLPLGNGTLLPGVHPVNERLPLGRHIITVWSATGHLITETLELKMVNDQFVQEIDVWSEGKRLIAVP
ncbi:MAG: hypothetical protein DME76_18275 [Verrucomicrobia bacterium]|nr:MAG: hypothetical protein DME76_18275 [Verrucomicrobiota bacterium]